MKRKTIIAILAFGMSILSGCENTSAEQLVDQYAQEAAEAALEKARETASDTAERVNDKIDDNEVTSGIKQGLQTAKEYGEDAYDYVTDKDNIEGAKNRANDAKGQATNFFTFMFGRIKEQWEDVKNSLTDPDYPKDEEFSWDDASEYDFIGDYTNPWLESQGIDTSSQGTALEQFRETMGQVARQARETANDIKQNHDAKHPGETNSPVSDDMEQAETNTRTTRALSEAILKSVPEYSGAPYIVVNDNVPFFDGSELTTDAFEIYSDLDSLGRCGVAYANVCREIMPTKERESIGSVKPSGWNQAKYDVLKNDENPAGYAQCRMHLIAYTLAGENANEKNLITGSFACNVEGMEPFELDTSYYVKSTGNHVLYRVTPCFFEDELMARGVLMEAMSVEDDGLMFCVFCYNNAPGIVFDYATGKSHLAE